MSKNRILNRAHQKSWYSRVRNDPVRWRAFLEKRKVYKQAKRSGIQPFSLRKTKPKPVPETITPEASHSGEITWDSLCRLVFAGSEE
jgi:hypothetical protein